MKDSMDILRSWLFKGLTIEQALSELENNGVAVRAATDPQALQRVMPMEDFSSDLRRAGMQALPAYLAFFMLENSVRELIESRLHEKYGHEWWAKCASSRVRQLVSKRQETEGKNRWHMQRGASEIYYTDFGDLSSIIQNNWEDFEDLFPDITWVSTRFSELEASRNIVAHNNLLDDRELIRLKMYVSDWIKQVG